MSSSRPDRTELLGEVLRQVRRMTAQSVLIGEAVSERFGLNSSDLECLDLALLSGGASAGEFAKATGLTTGAITGVIDRLEQAGYVRRERDPSDRRKVLVRARPVMTRRIAPLYDSLQREMTALWSRYGDEELAVILDFLTRSCDLAVQEIAKLRSSVPTKRRAGVGASARLSRSTRRRYRKGGRRSAAAAASGE
jgi:DNA-binding MarR family transcriptional regulator